MKVQSITKHFFMKGKQNISSLHKIICSLVSLFLLCIMKDVTACKVSSVFNHISSSFLETSFVLEREHRAQQQTLNTIKIAVESTHRFLEQKKKIFYLI